MKRPKGLPEWFSLENYNDTKLLSPFEWFENLHKRRMFFVYQSIANSNRKDLSPDRKENAKTNCQIIVNLITKKPVFRTSDEIHHLLQISL